MIHRRKKSWVCHPGVRAEKERPQQVVCFKTGDNGGFGIRGQEGEGDDLPESLTGLAGSFPRNYKTHSLLRQGLTYLRVTSTLLCSRGSPLTSYSVSAFPGLGCVPAILSFARLGLQERSKPHVY